MSVSTVNLSGTKTGEGMGSSAIGPFQVQNINAPDNSDVKAFTAATFAAVTVPATATGVVIVPPTNNTGTITFKGVTGDTGVTLNKTQPGYIPLDAGASFGLLCANSISVEFRWT